MQKHILTQEDLDGNPELVKQGLKVGEEVDLPVAQKEDQESDSKDEDGLPHPPTTPIKP